MANKIHLSGMGLVGSLLALRLADEGVDFTRDDADAAVTAYRASTGCAYPSDQALDRHNYNQFPAKVLSHPFLGRRTILGTYAYTAARVPHFKSPKKVVLRPERYGCIRLLRDPSYHVNPARLVSDVREAFGDRRRKEPTPGALRVHAHGFHKKFGLRFLWGWRVSGHLILSDKLRALTAKRPLCLDLQHMRYGSWYAYPAPGEP
jgi:hypothetical protein